MRPRLYDHLRSKRLYSDTCGLAPKGLHSNTTEFVLLVLFEFEIEASSGSRKVMTGAILYHNTQLTNINDSRRWDRHLISKVPAAICSRALF